MVAIQLKALLKADVPDLRKINVVTKRIMQRPKMQKTFFKLMTKIWSEDEDSRRILALLNILKAIDLKPECASLCIKLMFMAYVRNCKFVLGSTLPHINFMRQSLLEVFSKDLDEAYLHAFAYIRQLAIGLRKAHTSHSKEDAQAVQNWQFINSLRLWTDLVAKYAASHQLIHSLVHPLVQLIVATTKLNPGERWIPLRIHCVSMLHSLAGVPMLSDSTAVETNALPGSTVTRKPLPLVGKALSPAHRVLVPSVPLLLDIFQLVNFNRRASSASKAPLDLRLLLHFSPSQRRETASLDAIVSWLIDLLTEAAAIQANSLAFPEYALPMTNALKQFVHTCRVSAFTRQAKALLAKIREHSEWIVQQRRRLRSLANPDDVVQLESMLTVLDGTVAAPPFWTFYVNHKQVRATELAHLTKCHQKDVIASDDTEEKFPGDRNTKKMKRPPTLSEADASDESESSDSDASYDYDDGVTVTHVSKSKGKSATPVAANRNDVAKTRAPKKKSLGPDHDHDASEESDFDLEAALNEPEENAESDSDDGGAAPDEVTDFELSDSEDDNEQDDDDDEEEEEEESSDSELGTSIRDPQIKRSNSVGSKKPALTTRGKLPVHKAHKRRRPGPGPGQAPHRPVPKKLKLTQAKVKSHSPGRNKK